LALYGQEITEHEMIVLALGYAVSTLDELQSRIQVKDIAIGLGIIALITLAFGLLGLAGMPQPDWLMVAVGSK
jgi:hypothetical protein